MKNRRRAAVSAATLMCVAGMAQAQSFSEGFESGALPATWVVHNQSNPLGATQWGAGNNPDVPVHTGAFAAYANFANGDGLATLSDWLMTDVVTLRNGDTLSFWTITDPVQIYPDRLQVRMSTAGASTNTGSTEFDVGDFSTLLLDINPTYTTTGYPGVNTQFTVGPLTGLPGAGVTGRFAFRYFVEAGGPLGANSDVINIDDIEYTSSADPTGACCFIDGTCAIRTSGSCAGQGGSYSGDSVTCAAANCSQPPSGACCAPNGTCTFVTAFACTASGGTWSGAGVTCAAANCQPVGWVEVGDAGETSDTAQTVSGPGAANLQYIKGSLTVDDADVYKLQICAPSSFGATLVGGATFDTQLWLFNSAGVGVAFNDDSTTTVRQSTLTNAFVTASGQYYLGISGFDNDAVDSGAQELWLDQPYDIVRAPDGPGAANPWAAFDHADITTGGNYQINLTGACFISSEAACYANCDGSTSTPVLNANDFNCFLNKYAANDTYANCDGSTSSPVLNANDFNCFLNKYAAGCT